ncbi:MAG: hypothetical protein HYV29_01565, partial [Ignavibacteriales bacterium]|nr:hypothetical protein [Ignavibacteriales bacterium]
ATARGLNRWKPFQPGIAGSDGTLSPITSRNGLYDDATNQLIESGQDIWIGSIHGIYRVRKKELNAVADGSQDQVTCLRLGKSDGMINEECGARGNSGAWKTSDGKLWFSTSGGAVAFDPKNIGTSTLPPEVNIEDIAVENRPAALAPEIVLQPGQTKLDVRYTGINFSAPRSIRFKYILEGSDKDWVDAGRERMAHYTNLDAGSYTFRVIASSNAGIWNEQGASLRVTVLPLFWMTWWFRSAFVLLVVATIVWSVRFNEQRKMKEKIRAMEKAAAVERERLRIARDLHDELGARLTEIGLMTDFAKKGKKKSETQQHLANIGSTARGMIDSFREIVWAVNPQQDTLDSLIDFLEQYALRFLKQAEIRCRLDIPEMIPEISLSSDQRHGIFMAVKESLNNIVKHARATEVKFSVHVEPNTVLLSIEDNGRGFSGAQLHRFGNGVANMKKRIESVGGSAEISSVFGKGTVVKFRISV